MAILYRAPGVIVCGADSEATVRIGKRTYRWEFHNILGPTFLRLGNGNEPLKRQPGEKHPVWKEFYVWFLGYAAKRKDDQGVQNALRILKESYADALDRAREAAGLDPPRDRPDER